MPASSSRIAGATLIRRASSAVPASAASRIRNIWNLASTLFQILPPLNWRGRRARSMRRFSLPHIVAVRFGDDLPAVGKLHRHQIVGEIARRQLAAHLDEGGGFVGSVDGDDEILARLAFRFRGGPLPDPIQPNRHGKDLQLALFQRAQVGGGVEDRTELVGVAFVEGVEIVLDHGFDAGTVMAHCLSSPQYAQGLSGFEFCHELVDNATGMSWQMTWEKRVTNPEEARGRVLAGKCLCGSVLYSVVRDGGFVHVAMGTLVDNPAIRPTAHIFVGSKAPWFTITDGLPQYDGHVVAD